MNNNSFLFPFPEYEDDITCVSNGHNFVTRLVINCCVYVYIYVLRMLHTVGGVFEFKSS